MVMQSNSYRLAHSVLSGKGPIDLPPPPVEKPVCLRLLTPFNTKSSTDNLLSWFKHLPGPAID